MALTMRTIALDPDEPWTSTWDVVQERDCDPQPGTYALRNPNGSLHHKYRGYNSKISLERDAKEDFELIRVGNHILKRR